MAHILCPGVSPVLASLVRQGWLLHRSQSRLSGVEEGRVGEPRERYRNEI